jgi:hypothetical protein
MEYRARQRNFLITTALAVVLGLVIAALGLLPWNILGQANLQWWSNVPWSVPAGLLWLFFSWRYLSGAAWPASTAHTRRELLRATPLHGHIARWSVVAGVSGLIALVTLYFISIQFVDLPASAFRPRSIAALGISAIIGALLMTVSNPATSSAW